MLRIKLIRWLILLWSGVVLSACSNLAAQQDNQAAALANVQLAFAYLQQGQSAVAKQKLLLAVQQAPHNPAPWYAMGYFLQTHGDLRAANDYYQHAVNLAPHDGAAQNNYGVFLCRTGHYRQAVKHLLAAAQAVNYLHPANAYENAGLCALKIPDQKSALKYFQQALAHDSRRVIAHKEIRKLDAAIVAK